ncbi:autophagy-related protein 16-like isoform X2 [Sphaerodactylus townsendi]|uniref:autophagy-related protein 16-like isoform X2 n=1 Tax=Sphaerodactylus townsendi TaxID=933632 RepID=UPI002025B77D|nr:autophagy-related protein 16-like isoform X2 [Sphaerodactylus townsendi]
MARAAWRQHVREALEERDGRTRCLCGLLEQHEKLQLRLEMLLGGAGVGVRYQLEVVELRRERAELHQQLAVVTEALEKTEAEARGQRDRIRHLFRDLGALKHQHQRLLCQAWGFSQEAEGLRGELDLAWRLLREAQQELLVLEDRWVREKAQEAARLNRANEREEKHQRKVSRLLAKLERVGAGKALLGPKTAASEAGCSASREEAETAADVGLGQATPTSSSSPERWARSQPGSTGARPRVAS